ncbi:MAG: type VI secretion system ImpA family N-terminal domain-containing protein [Pseudomonadota bacterium]|nr:type VI secretion system ImpA family N-terminal domain-containing protein [Pseudomonadota bacterium]
MTESLTIAPISPEEPCGPDLDLTGDPDFMNFLAATEGLLPASFFDFERKSIDFPAAFAVAAQLRKRTHDLRLVLLVAKLAVLNRDFYGFARAVAEIAALLSQYWDEAHPRGEEGDYSSRLAQLGTLDDGPVVILPLQYATLLQSEREGPLSYRAVMVNAGDVKLREGEKLASAGVVERILTNIDADALANLHATLSRLRDDLGAIAEVTAERAGAAGAVRFNALAPLVEKMLDFAQAARVRRDPTLAPASVATEGAPDEPQQGEASFAVLSDVDAALASALGYFQNQEPSSPALLLIAQARATLGKNLYEVMRLLAPRHADNARVFVGPEGAFAIPVSSLQDAPALDFSPGDAPAAESRARAFGLIEQVAAHLRRVEPSSPAPYLLDRARALAARDFLTLLGELYAPDELETMKNGN